MICRDAIALESPAAQAELTLLRSLAVGASREEALFPALEVGVVWRLVLKTEDRWEFDGTFFGQPLYTLIIRIDGAKLTLNVQEAR